MFWKSYFTNNDFFKSIHKKTYNTPDSCLKEYHNFLQQNGVYPSLYSENIRKQLKKRKDLCDGVLMFYRKAKLSNERLSFLEDLYFMGYDKDKLVELILNAFDCRTTPTNLWEYSDLLYSIKNFNYLPQYLTIIQNKTYGEARQMLILLVGKSKNPSIIPVLKELLSDSTVYGHVLDALSNFSGCDIDCIMRRYTDSNIVWIRKIAENYLKENTGDG